MQNSVCAKSCTLRHISETPNQDNSIPANTCTYMFACTGYYLKLVVINITCLLHCYSDLTLTLITLCEEEEEQGACLLGVSPPPSSAPCREQKKQPGMVFS